jgi:hypothetical protein
VLRFTTEALTEALRTIRFRPVPAIAINVAFLVLAVPADARCDAQNLSQSLTKLSDSISTTTSASDGWFIKDQADGVREHVLACMHTAAQAGDLKSFFMAWYSLAMTHVAYAVGDLVEGNLTDARDDLKPARAIGNQMISEGKDNLPLRQMGENVKERAQAVDDRIRKEQQRLATQ